MAAARGLGRREKMRVPRGIRLRVQIGATRLRLILGSETRPTFSGGDGGGCGTVLLLW